MFLFARPATQQIQNYLAAQKDKPFSYKHLGASANSPPKGYVVDHNRVRLGTGAHTYKLAMEAINRWKMFDFSWIQLCWPDTSTKKGSVVAVVVQHFGFWSINSCRVVYEINDDGPIAKYGFAYGTLVDHAECGEERFSVEWHKEEDSVWYDILAFSKPNALLAKFAYPLARSLQRKFARASMEAMLREVQTSR
jgi:uncharacterized protein (UPF0548 family)